MLLLLCSLFSTALAYNSEFYDRSLQLKCESYSGRSLFYKSVCYLIIDAESMKCSEVIPALKMAKRQLSDREMRKLKFLAEEESTFNRRGEDFLNYKDKLCVLSAALHCPPDAELIGTKCFYLNENMKTHKEAMADCEYKGMKMFYPHSDEDIKSTVEFAAYSNTDEIWLSAVKQARGQWNMNDGSPVFDYARWFDTTLLTSSQKKLNTKLSVVSNNNTSLGYMSVVEESSTTRLASICSSMPSTEPIVIRTTALTTTTPTTTTTKRTTTTTTKRGTSKMTAMEIVSNLKLLRMITDKDAIMRNLAKTTFPSLEASGFYIGLRDFSNNVGVSAQYRWDETNYRLGYTNWFRGEPSRWSTGPEMCTAIMYNRDYTWNDVTCESGEVKNLGIICATESQ